MKHALRLLSLPTLVVLFIAAIAAPAWAHEEINPKTTTVGQPTFFLLSAANEQKAPLTKVVLTAPAGLSFGSSTRSPSGWTADRTDSVITWTGGSVAPDNFDQWGFEIEGADQPGTLTFKVTLTAGGDSEDVNVPVTAVAAGGSSSTTATTAPSSPTTAAGASPTTVTTAGAQDANSSALASSVKHAKDKAGTAELLGIIALVLALLAIVVALVRRGSPSNAVPAGPAKEQDF